jgi:hypothetical protein
MMSFALLAPGDTGDGVNQFAEHHLSSAGRDNLAHAAALPLGSLPIPPPNIRSIDPGPRGENMTQQRDSLAFGFAGIVALAVIVLAATTWALHHKSASAVPIPTDAIYQALEFVLAGRQAAQCRRRTQDGSAP